MKYTPLPKNRKNSVLSLVLLITSVVVFYLGTQYYTKARAAVQTLGVLCLAFASFFILKKLTVYTYSVYPKDGAAKKSVSDYGPDDLTFVVSKRFGAGAEANKASLELSCLTKTVALPFSYFEKKKILKAEGRMALYYYTVTFKPPESLLLVFDTDAGRVGIVIEPDTDFKGFLEKIASMNPEKEKEEEEKK